MLKFVNTSVQTGCGNFTKFTTHSGDIKVRKRTHRETRSCTDCLPGAPDNPLLNASGNKHAVSRPDGGINGLRNIILVSVRLQKEHLLPAYNLQCIRTGL